jgi:hypothetical protein
MEINDNLHRIDVNFESIFYTVPVPKQKGYLNIYKFSKIVNFPKYKRKILAGKKVILQRIEVRRKSVWKSLRNPGLPEKINISTTKDLRVNSNTTKVFKILTWDPKSLLIEEDLWTLRPEVHLQNCRNLRNPKTNWNRRSFIWVILSQSSFGNDQGVVSQFMLKVTPFLRCSKGTSSS